MATDGSAPGVEADSLGSFVRFLIDPALYTEAAIFKTVYWFTGKFFVFVDQASDGRIVVELRPKSGADIGTAIGEFCNALVDARVRQIVLDETGTVRDELIRKAFQEGMPKPGFSGVRSNEAALEVMDGDDATGSGR